VDDAARRFAPRARVPRRGLVRRELVLPDPPRRDAGADGAGAPREGVRLRRDLFGHPEGQAEFQKWFDQWGLAVILIKGATPIPYKLVTITAGLARFDLFTFIWASVLTRGVRFFAVAAILKYFGPAMLQEFERRLNLYSILLLALLVGGIVLLKFVF